MLLINTYKDSSASLSVVLTNTAHKVETENINSSVIVSETDDIYESVPTSEVEPDTKTETETDMKAEIANTQIEESEEVEPVTETSTEFSPLYTFTYSKGSRKLNIRKGPTVNDKIIGKIPPNGTGIIIEFVDDEWALIEYDGIEGYCCLRWMSISETY